MDENDKEAIKKNKQRRKMTKILSKAWNFESASPFRQDKLSSASSQPLDLQVIGQKLDDGGYENGRRGWETFARDLGGVYHRHILGYVNLYLSEVVFLLLFFSVRVFPHISFGAFSSRFLAFGGAEEEAAQNHSPIMLNKVILGGVVLTSIPAARSKVI
jgi:hypothetical protein